MIEMCYFAQTACLHVTQTPSSVHRGSERCPIQSCRTQLGCLKRNAAATLKEVLSLGQYGIESQPTPLPRQKYRAFVPGRLAPAQVISNPLPESILKGKGKERKEAETRMAKLPRKRRAGTWCGIPTPTLRV